MIVSNEKVIVRQLGLDAESAIVTNDFAHCLIATPAKGEETETLSLNDLPEQKVSVPLSFWQANKSKLLSRDHEVAVQLGAADFAEDIVDDLNEIHTIVLPFE